MSTITRLKRIFWSIVIFAAGIVFCANLVRLVNTNGEYEASWAKVVAAILILIVFTYFNTTDEKDRPIG
jgi:hypothetical protein